ncbi:hypothetical protein BT96DRAFT_914563 [Gymnopus androsaceus JB14]|uniref:Uncharacterized protein n=1 Tax=Gymnopus androsaceus JB14 TaxID=1447944 RepID=A0A6A4IA94_9AGAR|nr:hypothetical protein BT96DRAFT_914563 [Gymnopus androsaceus JB14]
MTSKNTFFDHSHDFNIYGGEFTNVAGDQVIVSHNHHYNNQGSLGSAMVTASGNRYRSIPIGDMFIHRTISSTTMYIEAPGKDKDIPQHRLLNKPFLRLLKKPFLQSNASGNKKTFVLDPSLPQARVKVVRTVSSVQLIDFPASGNFTAITYDGPGAQKAFKNDLLFFSKSRTPSIAQLFGIVQDTLPALVFHTGQFDICNDC